MKNYILRFFAWNGPKIAGWLPIGVVKIAAVSAAALMIGTTGFIAVRSVMETGSQNNSSSSSSNSSGLSFDESATEGIPGKSKEEIQKELDAKVAASNFAISINTSPVFPNATSEGNLNIINSPSNTYLMVVEIYTSDNVLIYKSGAIKPNQSIEKVKLSTSLPKGEHETTAYFLAYNPDTQEYIGKAGAKVKINILN